MGVWEAVCTFHDGSVSRLKVLKESGVEDISLDTERAITAADNLRVKKAKIAVKLLTKEARTARRWKKLKQRMIKITKQEDFKSF